MGVIINWIESVVQFFFMLFKLIVWLLGGVANLGIVLTESVNILMEVMDFLPDVVSTCLVAVCGILVTLRIIEAL